MSIRLGRTQTFASRRQINSKNRVPLNTSHTDWAHLDKAQKLASEYQLFSQNPKEPYLCSAPVVTTVCAPGSLRAPSAQLPSLKEEKSKP
jgi:hypothetical protein